MRKVISSLVLCLLVFAGMSAAQTRALMDSPIADVDKEFPGLELLPPGSVLEGVSLPRYKENKLNVLVTSPYMKVESRIEFSGLNVYTYLYDEGQTETTRMFMEVASYFFDTKMLFSRKKTIINDYRLEALGTGMTFDTTRKVGFMHGPVETVIHGDVLKKKQ